MKVYCVFSLESPHGGNSEYIQNTIINIKKKSPKNIPNTIMSALWDLFIGDSRTSLKQP